MMNQKELSNKIFKVFCALNDKDEKTYRFNLCRKAKKANVDIETYIIKNISLPANYMMIIESQMRI